MSSAPQEIIEQLKFNNGQKSKAERFYFTVLDEFANPAHLYSRATVARHLGASVTIAQVATAVNWLARRHYLLLDAEGRIIGLTARGEQVVNNRNGKEKAK